MFSLQLPQQTIPLPDGARLKPGEIPGLAARNPGDPVAEVVKNPWDANILGLKNLSAVPWNAVLPNGTLTKVDLGQSVKLSDGTRINFGSIQGEIREQIVTPPQPWAGSAPTPNAGIKPTPWRSAKIRGGTAVLLGVLILLIALIVVGTMHAPEVALNNLDVGSSISVMTSPLLEKTYVKGKVTNNSHYTFKTFEIYFNGYNQQNQLLGTMHSKIDDFKPSDTWAYQTNSISGSVGCGKTVLTKLVATTSWGRATAERDLTFGSPSIAEALDEIKFGSQFTRVGPDPYLGQTYLEGKVTNESDTRFNTLTIFFQGYDHEYQHIGTMQSEVTDFKPADTQDFQTTPISGPWLATAVLTKLTATTDCGSTTVQRNITLNFPPPKT